MRILQIIVFVSTLFIFLYSGESIVTSSLSTGSAVVPNDKEYFKHKDSHTEIIFTKENLAFAKQTAQIENQLHQDYESLYNWKLDDTLFVGLISSHNQIANGFSTQWPKNRQINYMGGTQMIDYFTATSWLDTLIYHETAHNYQLNVKGSKLSQNMHTIFGNGSIFSYLFPITVPNSMENSFMLEGNAVLNESWHGNGGRLYSGRFKAETILQAKAGNIVAGEVYNSKLAFPYGDMHYIIGGFYNLYMAQHYGIKSINSYFKYHSQDVFFPQYTNKSMKKATGINFEQSLHQFANKYAHKQLVMAKGLAIANSQFFYPLGNNQDEIFFITNESGVQKSQLNVLEKKTSRLKKVKDSWISGKVIKIDDKYYTQGGKHISPYFIAQGIFCSEGFIKEGTESKMVQGYLSDSTPVYFDVKSSFSQAQLYVGKQFYASVNSSVVIDTQDNLYYFIQQGKTRTLYKNKKPLYSYEGYYGIVSDVDSQGAVYFIANSKNGATLYRYKNKKITRASEADNIIDAKLVNDTEILIAAISEKDYYYVKNKLKVIYEAPYETKLFFEETNYYAHNNKIARIEPNIELNDSYIPLLEMHYSGANLVIGSGTNKNLIGSLSLDFGDSLSQNSANIFVSRDDSEVILAGAGYCNSQYILHYALDLYGVVDDFARDDVRKAGVIFGAELPFIQVGYYYGALSASYFQDYDTKEREPLSFSLQLSRSEIYGHSLYTNYLNALELYGVIQKDDEIFGASYKFQHDLEKEFYVRLGLKFSHIFHSVPDDTAQTQTRGVKLTNISGMESDMDPSKITMPSLFQSVYLKSAGYGEVMLAKVLNYSKYYFTFPLSLQRESLYAKYRYYEIKSYADKKFVMNEASVGLHLSSVFLNSNEIPINIEYIYNDGEKNFIKEKHQIRFLLGTSF